MSPTSRSTDDLRALLEQRAEVPDTGTPDRGTAARLAGVRARVRHRRRMQAVGAVLSVAALVAGLTTATAPLRRHAAVEPAQFPDVDRGGRHLAATLGADGAGVHQATTRLARGWADLHLVQRCSGPATLSTVVLVNGMYVAQAPCGGADHEVTVTREQVDTVGLGQDHPATVSVHLTRTPARGRDLVLDRWATLPDARASLAVYSPAGTTGLPPMPNPIDREGIVAKGADVELGSLTLPVTRDFGTRSFTVLPGALPPRVGATCSSDGRQPRVAVVVTVNDGPDPDSGPRSLQVPCGSPRPGETASSTIHFGPAASPTDDEATQRRKEREFWYALGAIEGGPITISMRAVRQQGDVDLSKAPDLAANRPGITAAVIVVGTPSSLPSPSAEQSQAPGPTALTLVATAGNPASATVRVGPSAQAQLELSCTGQGKAAFVTTSSGSGGAAGAGTGSTSTDACSNGPIGSGDGSPAGTVLKVTLTAQGTVRSVLKVHADMQVLSAVQPVLPGGTPESGVAAVGDLAASAPLAAKLPAVVTPLPKRPPGKLAAVLVVRGGEKLPVTAVPLNGYWSWERFCSSPAVSVEVTQAGDAGHGGGCVAGGGTTTTDSTAPLRLTVTASGPADQLAVVGLYSVRLQQ